MIPLERDRTGSGWGLTGDAAREVIEADFQELALTQLAATAIEAATAAGAEHADVRISRQRARHLTTRDARPLGSATSASTGIGVRVLVDGVWGFAGAEDLDADCAARLARDAVSLARVSAPAARVRVSLAPEPVHGGHAWANPVAADPFAVPEAEVIDVLAGRSASLIDGRRVHRADAAFEAARDVTFYADSHGTSLLQQRTRVASRIDAYHVADDRFEDMATCAPPTARGWEYVAGDDVWPWSHELGELADLLAEKVVAPSIEPGSYDLVIDPTNLWLTIHESVGHATELDRALGYEANYAGTSFATPDQLGALRYGSPLMHVLASRTVPFGLSTVGFDDEGVAAQEWDLVRAGTLVGYQMDRRMAAERGLPRSNGCAYADAATHVPVQRMPNVSLLADPAGPDLDGLLDGVTDGIYVVGDKSWSIDMQRYNFQFTGQRFFRIRAGRLAGQVRDVAYQSSTPRFWAGLTALGGPSTYLLGGALNCGKAQPGQVAPVSHGCPAAVFTGVNILNTEQERR